MTLSKNGMRLWNSIPKDYLALYYKGPSAIQIKPQCQFSG